MRYSIPIFWRNRSSYYSLEFTKCRRCGKVSFFKRSVCPYCGSRDVEIVKSRGFGKVRLFTISYFRGSTNLENYPRIIALIELEEGMRVIGELSDVEPDEVREGMEVEAVLRRLSSDDPYGLIYYGLKFIPRLKGRSFRG